MVKTNKLLPRAPYDLYMYGLNSMRERGGGQILSLEEARDLALADAEAKNGYEHIELIKAAYEELKRQEKEKKEK
jgi:hypothetical protein